jgi:hypothetical protein
MIAHLLHSHSIPFIYEKPTTVRDAGKTKIWYPDFTLSSGLIIEYSGMEHDRDYLRRMNHKLRIYRQNQLNVIILSPRTMTRNWRLELLDEIAVHLKKCYHDFCRQIQQGPVV